LLTNTPFRRLIGMFTEVKKLNFDEDKTK
jgi:hypothetical protein